jgi:hypothetical protein
MGNTTFAGFRSRLAFNLGNRDLARGQLSAWVNDGYFDLTGAFDFLELHGLSTATLEASSSSISLPLDASWVRSIKDDTAENPLIKISEEQFWSILDHTETGEPEYWTRQGNTLRVQPIPEEDLTLRLLYNKIPTALSANSDKTVLLPTFDRAIIEFSTYHALLDLGEELRAGEWLSRGMAYVRSRLLPQEFENDGPTLGVRVVRTKAQLRRISG